MEAATSEEFRKRLDPYLDSREHGDRPAMWPLIQHVKVLCRSPVLASGLILVDLPGTADTNEARNKMAKDFMKRCDHYWVVAPITRAVSDKVAAGEWLSRLLSRKMFIMTLQCQSYSAIHSVYS